MGIALITGGAIAITGSIVEAGQTSSIPATPMRWYKGNTHTHTINSDGDSTPDEVVQWYRTHGYQFLVLTDHNFLTNVDGLNALHAADEKFLVLRGEEVTAGAGGKPVHVNGLDVTRLVEAYRGTSVVDTLQRNIDGIRAASGVPHINHPNFGWAVTFDDLQTAKNYRLFEIHNGHPSVNNEGGGGVPGLEEVWDRLLTSGTIVYGLATDDAHVFKDPGNPTVSGPGRGWVTVRAPRLAPGALTAALERGDFYASTGVVLDEVTPTEKSLAVKVRTAGDSKYRVQFIGRGGQLLSEVSEPSASYTFKGTEGYVRAKVLESNGRVAWVQPVVVRGRTSAYIGWAAPVLIAGLVAYRRRRTGGFR
ncbi:MAG TPA: CehA/McbA family metallohydrolase [Vicinamibacterales bacterium]|nr:CehA/McbA family metallohydrolase [Vicinamibacterales bacterium]